MNFPDFISAHQIRIQNYLATILPSETIEPVTLHQAIRYSVLNGGKRIRSLLMYAIAETFNADLNLIDPLASAIEMIHCYSLIHDDLPAMDNDDLRRGLPTCHKAFDEATAILAGDALQALAFEVLATQRQMDASQILEMIICLSKACGSLGMAGGQVLDMDATGKSFSIGYVEKMHAKKTGALISASVYLAALASACQPSDVKLLEQYGQHLGLAFQIQDDILDIEAETATLGKQQGADLMADKLTYPGVVGAIKSKEKVAALYASALGCIKQLSRPAPLLSVFSDFIINRKN